jgi:hypothetical protein
MLASKAMQVTSREADDYETKYFFDLAITFYTVTRKS